MGSGWRGEKSESGSQQEGNYLVPRKQSEGEGKFSLRKHLRMGLALCRNVKCKDALQRSNRKSADIHEETSTREIHQCNGRASSPANDAK